MRANLTDLTVSLDSRVCKGPRLPQEMAKKLLRAARRVKGEALRGPSSLVGGALPEMAAKQGAMFRGKGGRLTNKAHRAEARVEGGGWAPQEPMIDSQLPWRPSP